MSRKRLINRNLHPPLIQSLLKESTSLLTLKLKSIVILATFYRIAQRIVCHEMTAEATLYVTMCMEIKHVFLDGLVFIRIAQRTAWLKKMNKVITTALKQARSSAWKIGIERIVQCIAKNTATKTSFAIRQLEKRSVDQIGTEVIAQISVETKMIQKDIFIVIKHQV